MLNHHPPAPPKSAAAQGFLMQKIIACERRSIPCLHADLCLNDCALTCIRSVCAAGAVSCWSIADGCTLRAALPLNVCACDACGRLCTTSAAIEVETSLPRSFACAMEDLRSTLLILPCVRLLRSDCAGGGCLGVQRAVSLELFRLRYTMLCQPQPDYPPLPLDAQPLR